MRQMLIALAATAGTAAAFAQPPQDARPLSEILATIEVIDDAAATKSMVDALMGTKPEARFRFIQDRAEFAHTEELDI